jgi:hypothetical protein
LPERSGIRGLRLRAGNIQIGDERILDTAFPEPRFNAWSVGEVHLISKRIVPNGRRDDIEYSAHQQNLVKHVMPVAKQITKLSRSKSAARHSVRTAEPASADELTLQFSDYLNPKQLQLLNRCSPDRVEAYVEVLQFVQEHCPKSSGRVTVKRILEAIVQRLETAG